jgi:AcrR family transcriptional regulator
MSIYVTPIYPLFSLCRVPYHSTCDANIEKPGPRMSIDTTSQHDAKRTYQMSKRAESTAQTEQAIFAAAAELWIERAFADITLEAIAARAGVSVRTVIRRYGSKEGLYEAGIQNDSSNMQAQRDLATPGDIDSALDYLLADYETYGDAIIRTLEVEGQLEAARKVLQAGRAYHRKWCEKVFAPYLPDGPEAHYEQKVTAFVAATDLYLWKLLRRDLKQSLNITRETFYQLIKGLTNKGSGPNGTYLATNTLN